MATRLGFSASSEEMNFAAMKFKDYAVNWDLVKKHEIKIERFSKGVLTMGGAEKCRALQLKAIVKLGFGVEPPEGYEV